MATPQVKYFVIEFRITSLYIFKEDWRTYKLDNKTEKPKNIFIFSSKM